MDVSKKKSGLVETKLCEPLEKTKEERSGGNRRCFITSCRTEVRPKAKCSPIGCVESRSKSECLPVKETWNKAGESGSRIGTLSDAKAGKKWGVDAARVLGVMVS